MWKREEPAKPKSALENPVEAPSFLLPPTPPDSPMSSGVLDQTADEPRGMREEMVGVGSSIVISGELRGSEDLTVHGCVEGKIELRDHVLTVGSNGRVKAQVTARAIVVLGKVTGNLIATEKVDIRESGSVEGDIMAPRVAIADGSRFRGSIDMRPQDQQTPADLTSGGPKAESQTPRPETQKLEPSSVNGEIARVI